MSELFYSDTKWIKRSVCSDLQQWCEYKWPTTQNGGRQYGIERIGNFSVNDQWFARWWFITSDARDIFVKTWGYNKN